MELAVEEYLQGEDLAMADRLVAHRLGPQMVISYWEQQKDQPQRLYMLGAFIQRLDQQRHKVPFWK